MEIDINVVTFFKMIAFIVLIVGTCICYENYNERIMFESCIKKYSANECNLIIMPDKSKCEAGK